MKIKISIRDFTGSLIELEPVTEKIDEYIKNHPNLVSWDDVEINVCVES